MDSQEAGGPEPRGKGTQIYSSTSASEVAASRRRSLAEEKAEEVTPGWVLVGIFCR